VRYVARIVKVGNGDANIILDGKREELRPLEMPKRSKSKVVPLRYTGAKGRGYVLIVDLGTGWG
jgi:hypothetical protein